MSVPDDEPTDRLRAVALVAEARARASGLPPAELARALGISSAARHVSMAREQLLEARRLGIVAVGPEARELRDAHHSVMAAAKSLETCGESSLAARLRSVRVHGATVERVVVAGDEVAAVEADLLALLEGHAVRPALAGDGKMSSRDFIALVAKNTMAKKATNTDTTGIDAKRLQRLAENANDVLTRDGSRSRIEHTRNKAALERLLDSSGTLDGKGYFMAEQSG